MRPYLENHMSKTLSATLTLGLACFIVPSPLWAQTAPPTPPAPPPATPNAVEAVVVEGQGPRGRRDLTISRIVVGRDELVRFGDTELTDALKRLPGVTITAGAPGRAGGISLRGMGQGYSQVLINGQKAPAGFEIDSLTPDMVERVEIIRSPTADLRAEGIGGTINIVLSRGAPQEQASGSLDWRVDRGRSSVTAAWRRTWEESGDTRSLSVTLARRVFQFDETGVELRRDGGREVLLRTTRLDLVGVRNAITLAPNVNLELDNGDKLAFQGLIDLSRLERAADVDWVTVSGADLAHPTADQQTTIDVAQVNGSLEWTRLFDAGGSLTTKGGLGLNREKYAFREQGYSRQGTLNLDDLTDSDLRILGFTSTGKYTLPTRGMHVIQAGWETSFDRRQEDRAQRLRPVGGAAGRYEARVYDTRLHRVALFAQDEIRLGAALSTYWGVRWERVDIRSASDAFPEMHNQTDLLSPTFLALWKIPGDVRQQVRLAFNRTYKLPTLQSLTPRPYTATNNQALTPDEQGNPGLRPERATGFDLAYERHLPKGAQLSIGGYLRQIDDVVRSETRLAKGRWVSSPFNGGSALVWGLEGDTRFKLSQIVRAAPDIQLQANATYSDSSVAGLPGPDDRITGQIPFSATVGGDYDLRPGWTLGASYGYRSPSTIQVTQDRIERRSSQRELEAFLLWSVGSRAKLRLSGSNLTGYDPGSSVWRRDGVAEQGVERRRRTAAAIRLKLELKL